jgi:hypothetical protein
MQKTIKKEKEYAQTLPITRRPHLRRNTSIIGEFLEVQRFLTSDPHDLIVGSCVVIIVILW